MTERRLIEKALPLARVTCIEQTLPSAHPGSVFHLHSSLGSDTTDPSVDTLGSAARAAGAGSRRRQRGAGPDSRYRAGGGVRRLQRHGLLRRDARVGRWALMLSTPNVWGLF